MSAIETAAVAGYVEEFGSRQLTNTSGGDDMQLGLHLRTARLARGLRLRELAEKAGCSESFVSKLENNKLIPSIRRLKAICDALGITVGDLFSWAQDSDNIVVVASEHRKMKLSSAAGPGITMERLGPPRLRLGGFVNSIEPGWFSGPLSHEGEELGYVLEGTIELTVGERSFELSTGDSYSFRSDITHSYRNSSNRVGRVIIVNSPPSI